MITPVLSLASWMLGVSRWSQWAWGSLQCQVYFKQVAAWTSLGGKAYGPVHVLRCYQIHCGSPRSSGGQDSCQSLLCNTEKTVLQPKVFETIGNVVINGLGHSNFMTQLEDGDRGVCRLHFEVKVCDHKFSVVLCSKHFREGWTAGNLEGPAF